MKGRRRGGLAEGFIWLEYGFVCIADGMLKMFDSLLYGFQNLVNGGQIDARYVVRKKNEEDDERIDN